MEKSAFARLEKLLSEVGGEYGLNHSKRLLELVKIIAEDKPYNQDVIRFCAYTHDLGASSKYAKEGVDHAVRSKEVAASLLTDFDFTDVEKEIILETIEKHHSEQPGESIESVLLRDADAVDFLGYIGIARDFSRAPKDIRKGFKSIQAHRNKLPGKLVLDSSRKLAEKRIQEMDEFIKKFPEESFDCF